MQEELITFETAKLAKEKGLCDYFNQGTNYVPAFYSEDKINFEETEFQQEDCVVEDRYFKPTQSLLQKWLREVHKIHIEISTGSDEEYGVIFGKAEAPEWVRDAEEEVIFYKTYEEALEVGLQHSLKLIK